MNIVARNRRARYDYEITDTIEVGIILEGHEVKSCRAGNVNLAGSYVVTAHAREKKRRGGTGRIPRLMLRGATIARYKFASGLPDYEPGRDRELLLHKRDRERLESAIQERGVSLIPLEVCAGKFIKVLLGLGRGRKRYDKRQRIREKEVFRKLKRGEEI